MSQSFWLQFRDDIKSSISCVDYLHSRGFNVSRPGASIQCPPFIRLDHSPSFGVYDQICIDFANDKHYDVIDLCALDQFDGNLTHALEYLAGRKLPHKASQSHSTLYNSQLQNFAERVRYWTEQLQLNQSALSYLADRGIPKDKAIELQLGFSPKLNRLMIPYFNKNHQPVYAAGRDLSGNPTSPKYWYMPLDQSKNQEFSEILEKIIFGLDSVHPAKIVYDQVYDSELQQLVKLNSHHIKYDYLAVCEGLFDVLSFRAEGWNAITGKISSKQIPEFLDICRQYRDKGKKIFICFDADTAGQNFQRNTALLLFKNGIPFTAGQLPKTFTVTRQDRPDFGQDINIKDISDYYAAGGSLDELVKNSRDGMIEIASLCKDEDELQQRFMEGARACDRWQLRKLKNAAISIIDNGDFEEVEDADGHIVRQASRHFRFDPKNVGFMYAEAMRPMQDCDIAKIVEDKHRLIYDTLGQFYEYRKGVWQVMNDLLIQQHIIRAMNGHISAQKVSGVCKYLKIDLAENVQFNTKHIVVFQNGTLWLDENGDQLHDDPKSPLHGLPKNFKASCPEDMSTLKLSYPYDPKSKNSALERAARDWTNHPDGSPDDAKYRLLKQMFGYILFVKNTLQKFFVLKGDGANGKSTCMNCIAAILGKENTTNLQLSRLSSEFDPIMLKHSRVNLCYDAQASIEAAQETLKALIGGDYITAAHKGVDAESFCTNAKFIVSANKFFSANDISRGLLRRMLFIAFNNTFEPKAGETSIEDEIMQDLPGLFNFAYEGYKDLMKAGYFCETEEQTALLEEFREQLSPIILFAREKLYTFSDPGLPVNDKLIYSMYKEWCEANGEKALGRTKFIPEIRQVIRVDGNVIPDPIRDTFTKEWLFTFSHRQEVFHEQQKETQISQESAVVYSAPVSEKQAEKQEQSQQQQIKNSAPENSRTLQKIPLADTIWEHMGLKVVNKSVFLNTDYDDEKASELFKNVCAATQQGNNWMNLPATQQVDLCAFLYKHPEMEKVLADAQSEYEAHKNDTPAQQYFSGLRIRIPDIQHEPFQCDEASGWGLFKWLKRFGPNWMQKLSGDYSYGVDDDHRIEKPITQHELMNLGVYLKKHPNLKTFLPGIDDILDFGE